MTPINKAGVDPVVPSAPTKKRGRRRSETIGNDGSPIPSTKRLRRTQKQKEIQATEVEDQDDAVESSNRTEIGTADDELASNEMMESQNLLADQESQAASRPDLAIASDSDAPT